MTYNPKSKNFSGFTMIELLVAMTLFVVLMAIAAGSFVKVMRTQRAIVSLMAVNDNASLTIEQMAREMRTGYHFKIISDTELQFVSAYNIVLSYRLNGMAMERCEDINNNPLTPACEKITADNVKITNFHFGLLGENYGDNYPPRITLAMSVMGTDAYLQDIRTNIQTTISSRILDP